MKEIKIPEMFTLSSVDDGMDVEKIDLSAMWAEINKSKETFSVDRLCLYVINATNKTGMRFDSAYSPKLRKECETAKTDSVYMGRGENGTGEFDDFCSVAKLAFLETAMNNNRILEEALDICDSLGWSMTKTLESLASEILCRIETGEIWNDTEKNSDFISIIRKMKSAVTSAIKKMGRRAPIWETSLDGLTAETGDKDDIMTDGETQAETADGETLDETDGEQAEKISAVETYSRIEFIKRSAVDFLTGKVKKEYVDAFFLYMENSTQTFETLAKLYQHFFDRDMTEKQAKNLMFRAVKRCQEVLKSELVSRNCAGLEDELKKRIENASK